MAQRRVAPDTIDKAKPLAPDTASGVDEWDLASVETSTLGSSVQPRQAGGVAHSSDASVDSGVTQATTEMAEHVVPFGAAAVHDDDGGNSSSDEFQVDELDASINSLIAIASRARVSPDALFSACDVSGSGVLTRKQFVAGLESHPCGKALSRNERRALARALDVKDDNCITAKKFRKAIRSRASAKRQISTARCEERLRVVRENADETTRETKLNETDLERSAIEAASTSTEPISSRAEQATTELKELPPSDARSKPAASINREALMPDGGTRLTTVRSESSAEDIESVGDLSDAHRKGTEPLIEVRAFELGIEENHTLETSSAHGSEESEDSIDRSADEEVVFDADESAKDVESAIVVVGDDSTTAAPTESAVASKVQQLKDTAALKAHNAADVVGRITKAKPRFVTHDEMKCFYLGNLQSAEWIRRNSKFVKMLVTTMGVLAACNIVMICVALRAAILWGAWIRMASICTMIIMLGLATLCTCAVGVVSCRRLDDDVAAHEHKLAIKVSRGIVQDLEKSSLSTGVIENTPGQQMLLACWSVLTVSTTLYLLLAFAGIMFTNDFAHSARQLALTQPGNFAQTFGSDTSPGSAANSAKNVLISCSTVAGACVMVSLLAMRCVVQLVTPFEVVMHWLETSAVKAVVLGYNVIALGIYGLHYNSVLPGESRAPAGIYVCVICTGVLSTVYAFFGYAAVFLEWKRLLQVHVLGSAIMVRLGVFVHKDVLLYSTS